MRHSGVRRLHTAMPALQKDSYGGLADEDRIFTNLYGEEDWGLSAAEKRVSLRRRGPVSAAAP